MSRFSEFGVWIRELRARVFGFISRIISTVHFSQRHCNELWISARVNRHMHWHK